MTGKGCNLNKHSPSGGEIVPKVFNSHQNKIKHKKFQKKQKQKKNKRGTFSFFEIKTIHICKNLLFGL